LPSPNAKTAKLWRGVRAWLQPDRTQDGFKLLQMGQCVLLLGIPSTLDVEVRWGTQTDAAAKTISGHCGLPQEDLLTLTRELLEVPAELVETALVLELQDGIVIADDLDGRR
jgi:hypothetical protein